MRTSSIALVLVLLAGCKGDAAKPAQSGSAAGSAGSAAPAATVAIVVDEQLAGQLAPDQVKLWPRLDSLVPVAARRLGTWQTIKLFGASSKPVEITQPSATYPELVPALFPGDKGPAFGMFDPVELAKHGKPTLREDGITEVRVVLAKGTGRGENDHHGQAGGDPAQLQLTIKAAKTEHVIAGDKLLAIDREAPPGDAAGKGWRLATLLTHAGVKGYERLLLTDAKGLNLTLEKQDLDSATSIPFIKLNRQGVLRFRVFKKQGDTWQPSSDLRGLTTVEVLK